MVHNSSNWTGRGINQDKPNYVSLAFELAGVIVATAALAFGLFYYIG